MLHDAGREVRTPTLKAHCPRRAANAPADRDAGDRSQVLKVDELASNPHSEAQASVKCVRSIPPVPTGDRAMRSSRRASAILASESGRRRNGAKFIHH